MKQYLVQRSGFTATMSKVPENKIPIYESYQELLADISNLNENQIVATKAIGDEASLTDLTAEMQLLKNSVSYSTDEVETSKVWNDKPVYRKTFYHEPGTAALTVAIDASSLNIDEVLNLSGGGKCSVGSVAAKWSPWNGIEAGESSSYNAVLFLWIDSSDVIRISSLGGGYSPRVYGYRITIEYTKD